MHRRNIFHLPSVLVSILIGLAIPSVLVLASSVVGNNISITTTTEQLRLGYDASAYTSFIVDASSSLSIVPANSAGGWKIMGNTISPNFVGGYSENSVMATTSGSVIVGGGYSGYPNSIGLSARSFIGAGSNNSITAGGSVFIGAGFGNIIKKFNDDALKPNNSVIVGGQTNTIQGWNENFIGGGYKNTISCDALGGGTCRDVIVGGDTNTTYGNGWATIVGGQSNTAWHYGFVGGGSGNIAGTSTKNYSVAVGGKTNNASGYNAMILGGDTNTASGTLSFASGKRAKAYNNGSFVWADNNSYDFQSSADNETAFRSTGGVRFVTAIDGSGNATKTVSINTLGDITLPGKIIMTSSTTPASASAACTVGTVVWDSSYVYVCVATNTWKRSAISTW